MPAPVLQSSSPADAEVNVNLNDQVTLTWNTPLLEATVTPALMVLENTDLDEIVNTTIQYTAGEVTVAITPDVQLEANTSYRLRLVGSDTATSLGPIKASDTTSLGNTITIVFQTGTELSTEGLEKSEEQEAAEGDLDLPEGVTVTTSDFQVVQTNPENRAWSVPKTLDSITVDFSDDLDASLVNANSVLVEIFPYLEDPEHFAVPSYQGADEDPQYLPQFEWQGDEDATGGTLDFDPPTGVITVDGDTITWTRQLEKDFPLNACVEVTLDRSLADTGGNSLGIDQRFTFYVDPYPDWVSARRIRRALNPIDLTDYSDDVLGLAVWNASVAVGDLVGWALSDMVVPPIQVRQLIEAKTIADVFRMLLAEKQLDAGQYMRLGDLEHEVRFPTSRAADVKPAQLTNAEAQIDLLTRKIQGYWLTTPRAFIKGRTAAHDRPNYRTRLWRTFSKRLTAISTPVVEHLPAGNTASERFPTLPGALDGWA